MAQGTTKGVPIDVDPLLANNSDVLVSSQKAVKTYVDTLINGIDWKASVNVATTTALPTYTVSGVGQILTGTATIGIIDGVTLTTNQRLLVKNETSALTPNNGIYVVTQVNPFILTRASDANTPALLSEATVSVSAGSTLSNTQWHCNPASGTFTIGTTYITFAAIGGTYTFNAPLVTTGNIISIPAATGSVNGHLTSSDWTRFDTASTGFSGANQLGYNIFTTVNNNATGYLRANSDNTIAWLTGSQLISSIGAISSSTPTTLGFSLLTATNQTGITFLRVNANNSVSFLDASAFRTAIGASAYAGGQFLVGNGVSGMGYGGTTPSLSVGYANDTGGSSLSGGTIDINNTATANNIIGQLQFSNVYIGTLYTSAAIKAFANTAPSGANSGGASLTFSTSPGGTASSVTERMRISHGGQVGIGTTTNTTYGLEVFNSNSGLKVTGTNASGLVVVGGSSSGIIATFSTVSTTEIFRVSTSTAMLMQETASTLLSTDANKNIKSLTSASGYPTLVELKSLTGISTTAIQTQLNGKEPTITAGTTSQYWRGDKSWQTISIGTWGALNYPTWTTGTPFVKMTADGTFTLDNTAYQPSSFALTGLAGLTYPGSGNPLIKMTGVNTFALDNTVYGQLANVYADYTTIGSDVQLSQTNNVTSSTIKLTMPDASGGARGALTSANWTTFNNKQNALNGDGLVLSSSSTGVTYITDSSSNWDTAYSERNNWNGGSTNLIAATGRASLGASTVGSNIFTSTTPTAIKFLRANANGTVDWLTDVDFRTSIGVGAGGGSVISVAALTLTSTSASDLSSSVALATTSPVITLNVPDAGTGQRGVVTASAQTFAANKTFTGPTNFKGTSTSDAPTLGVEILTTASTSSGWSGTLFSSGYTHTAGNTSILEAASNPISANSVYRIQYVRTGGTTSYVTFNIGGITPKVISNSGSTTFDVVTVDTSTLTITPQSTFNGTITVSLKLLNQIIPVTTIQNSAGAVRNEFRYSSSNIYNMAIGVGSGGYTTGDRNIFMGYNSGMFNSSGTRNTFIGNESGRNNISADDNVAIGNRSLHSNTTGGVNVAVGNNSLFLNTIGTNNVAIGQSALYQSTIGTNNVAIGYAALLWNNGASGASFNTAIGDSSLYNNTTGLNNTAVGASSSYNNTTGRYNTASGYSSLVANQTGWHNVANGYNAGSNSTGGGNVFLGASTTSSAASDDNSIVIGYGAIGIGSGKCVIGVTGVTTSTAIQGRLLLGNTADSATPTDILQVTGDVGITGAIKSYSITTDIGIANTEIPNGINNGNISTTPSNSITANPAVSYYIYGSTLAVPDAPKTAGGIIVGTKFVWRIAMAKTAAGSGAFAIKLYRGTYGSPLDTIDLTQTIGTATTAVDTMLLDITITIATTGANGSYWWNIIPVNRATTGGFGIPTGPGAFYSGTVGAVTPVNLSTAGLKFGIGFSNLTGTSTITIPMVQAYALNLL